jgi:hypothetical protein
MQEADTGVAASASWLDVAPVSGQRRIERPSDGIGSGNHCAHLGKLLARVNPNSILLKDFAFSFSLKLGSERLYQSG